MKKTTITGLEEKWEVLLIYIFSILGFIFAFMKYDYLSENIKFHYKQAGALWIVNMILSIAKVTLNYTVGLGFINLGFRLVSLVIWIFTIITIVKAFNNEKYEIPVISNIANSIWK
ncbi:MAG: hypothetical protein J6B64_02705 [Bacilli bacterium]|nr:hypothetical protein [Bacilli bacterium]MBP3635306.1 hypothetical protein [Bacilli bacterium]